MRKWSIEVYLTTESQDLIPANVYEKVTFELHPTFKNPKRSKSQEPLTGLIFADHVVPVNSLYKATFPHR